MILDKWVSALKDDCGLHMSTDWMIKQIKNPDWETMTRPHVHDWRAYVPDTVAEKWDDLSEETKAVCFAMAEQQANLEEWD